MSRETEQNFLEIKKYLDAHQDEIHGEDDIHRLIQQFGQTTMDFSEDEEDTADYWLEMAEDADSQEEALCCARKALALEPDNLDAARAVAMYSTNNPEDLIEKLEELLPKGRAQMEAGHYFEEDMGDFWLVTETRPYMRLRYDYMDALRDCGMLRRAVAEGEEMMRLCTNDNMGVRFALIFLYATLEDEASALELYNSNPLNEKNSQMLLAMSLLYYKLNQIDDALMYLKRLSEVNKDTKKFFTQFVKDGPASLIDQVKPWGYRPRTIEELIHAFLENPHAFLISESYMQWAARQLKPQRRTPSSSKKKSVQ